MAIETLPNLAESVTKAFADSAKLSTMSIDTAPVTEKGDESTTGETEGTTEDKAEENKPEAKVESKTETPEETAIEIDATEDEIKNGLKLFRSLANPTERAQVIEYLAKVGGYDLTKRGEVKQLERDTKTILREKLGDAYEILGGDKLGDAFDALLTDRVEARVKTRVEELTKPALEKIAATELAVNQQKANTAMESFFTRHKIEAKDRERVADKMMKKMETRPVAPNSDVSEYLDDMYYLVSKSDNEARTVKKVVTKIRTNAQEVSRTSGEGSGIDESRLTNRTGKLPSLDEAVKAGFRGERLE